QVRDLEGTLWHVRNGEILRVGNSSQGWARTVIDLPIPYDADIDDMADFLVKATKKALNKPGIKGNVAGQPEYLGVQSITGESVTLRLLVKTAPAAQFSVGRKLREELKKAMDAHGVRIPHTNQSVVLSAEPAVLPKKVAGADEHHKS
ncbi:MAG: mechanosensitive ion channel, partial [Rothia sp. (in: high G+C Gram-positive bacteria)]|nr:mechanosensitive ion channel [Rothia sp. (in: high G+C Gram-positive bacteria)]